MLFLILRAVPMITKLIKIQNKDDKFTKLSKVQNKDKFTKLKKNTK